MYKVVSRLRGPCVGLIGECCNLVGLAKFHVRSGALCQKSAFNQQPPDLPEMPPCDFKPVGYKAMSKERMMEIRRQNCHPMTMKVTYYKKPVYIHQGHMQWLWDVDGKRYLDLFAGVATVSVGHCHPFRRSCAEFWCRGVIHGKKDSEIDHQLQASYRTVVVKRAARFTGWLASLCCSTFERSQLKAVQAPGEDVPRVPLFGDTQDPLEGLISQLAYRMPQEKLQEVACPVATLTLLFSYPVPGYRKVTAAAEKQLRRLWHTTNIYVYPTLHEYCEKLASYLPDPLKVIYLTNSGSEANDLAMLMARLHTGNFDIITFRGSYHGGSPQTMGLTSNSAYKYPVANGLGCTNTMCPDVFRGPWGGSHCRDSPVQTTRECGCAQGHCMANDQYIGQLKETFATSVPGRIAAFFSEPIQGVGGAVQYPKNYLKEAYQLVRERGGICIADEVQTGFGRTGSHFWGFQGHDVIPDMVTMAKGIANGFPMGAVVTTPEIAASFAKGIHFNTFGGNPVACAIASSVLDTMKEDGTQQNSHDVGTHLLTELAKLRDKYEIIGDVRGKGLQIGVEMVKDKASRDPLSPEAMSEIFEDIKEMGILIGKGGIYGQTFRIKPPMCITMEDADFFLAVFNKSLHNYTDRR